MKILKIRFENINSLKRVHEIVNMSQEKEKKPALFKIQALFLARICGDHCNFC